MADHVASVRTLVREVVADAHQLIHDEIELARVEAREQTTTVKTIALWLGAAAVLALTGLVLLGVTAGAALAALFNWPAWIGYALVAVVAAAASYLMLNQGRSQLAAFHVLPKTRASVRENIAWIQSRSRSR